MDINFITSNPVVDEYNRANKLADAETAQDLKNKLTVADTNKTNFETQQAQQQAPTKLRLMNATADTQAARAQAEQATAPYAGPQAAAQLQQTRAQISEMNARTASIHMNAFSKELELLDAGDVDGAKRLAASVGDTIPDGIIQSSQARAALKNVTATAQQLYPGRPKDQMAYITAHIAELGNQQQQGKPINPATAPYTQPAGAPVPQETNATEKSGETERIAEQIRAEAAKNGKPMTYAESIALAHKAPQNDEMRKESLAQKAAMADPAYRGNPEPTLAKWRQYYGVQGGAPAPGAAPAPLPPRPPNVPVGSAYSASRNMWKLPDGTLVGADGKPAQAAAPAPQAAAAPAVQYPTLPQSQ
jgi:hypothetical protein